MARLESSGFGSNRVAALRIRKSRISLCALRLFALCVNYLLALLNAEDSKAQSTQRTERGSAGSMSLIEIDLGATALSSLY